MDNEISNGMSIAIEIIVLSAVIGFIMLFAAIGQQLRKLENGQAAGCAATSCLTGLKWM